MRQYIGARYVPRFSEVNNGVWSNVYSYEPLTIVKNGNDYYTSKQSVPVGVAITNTDYWIKTGDYNGAIASLQSDIDALEASFDAIPTNRKLIVMGDSFGYGVTAGSGVYTTGWIDYLKSKMPGQVFTHDRGDTPIAGSPAFLGSLPFMTIFDWIITNKITGVVNPAEITDVVVLGGNNEPANSLDNIESHIINTFMPHVKSICPNAKISIGCIGLDANQLVARAVPAYKNACMKTGACYISDTLNLGTQTQYDSQNGHWTVEGYQLYNPYIAHAVLYGHVNYTWYERHDLTLGSDVSIDGTGISFYLTLFITNREVRARLYVTANYSGWQVKYAKSSFSGVAEASAFNIVGKIYAQLTNGTGFCNGYAINTDTGGIVGCLNAQILLVSNSEYYIKFAAFIQGTATPSKLAYVWDGSMYNAISNTIY